MAAAPLRIETATAGGFDPRRAAPRIPDLHERNPGLVFLDSGASAQKPRSGHRRHRRVLPHRLRQCASRRLPAERPLDRPVRGGAREGARVPERRRRARDRLRARRHRGDQPGRPELGAGHSSSPATRSSSAISSTTRTSCRGRCCASGSAPGWSWRRPMRPASSTWRAFEALLSPRTRLVAVTHISNVTGALSADRAHRRAGACARAPRC